MEKLENTFEYRKLAAETKVYELILDLRIYRGMLSSSSKTIDREAYLMLIASRSNLLSRINACVEFAKERLIDLSEPASSTFVALTLSTSYKNESIKIQDVLSHQEELRSCCPNILPLGVELIEFMDICRNLLPKEYLYFLEGCIQNVLSSTPYHRASITTNYMLSCPNSQFFTAYFINNPSCLPTESSFIFNSLLKKAKEGTAIPEEHFSKMMNFKNIIPSYEIIESLVKPSSGQTRVSRQHCLRLLHRLGLSPQIESLISYFEEELPNLQATGSLESGGATIIENISILYPENDQNWMQEFIKTVLSLENGKRYLKAITSLLSDKSHAQFLSVCNALGIDDLPKRHVLKPKKEAK